MQMVGIMLLAVILGALIGLEREIHGHPAGLRTHILVCLGSAIAAIVSIEISQAKGDPGRVAAQVVAGIGFLGAGAIIREGASIRGLTTAASIWTTAMVGLAAGASPRTAVASVVATGIIVVVLWWLHHIEGVIETRGTRGRAIEIETNGEAAVIPRIAACITGQGASIRAFEVGGNHADDRRNLQMTIKLGQHASLSEIIAELGAVDGVRSVSVR